MPLVAAKPTYLVSPSRPSSKAAIHWTVFSCTTSFQACPGTPMTLGTAASGAMLIMHDSGKVRFFRRPCFGCSPRPRNNCGGSRPTAPSLSRMPFRSACEYHAFFALFSLEIASFSSFVLFNRARRASSRCSQIAVKSHFLKSLIGVSFGNTAWNVFQKLLMKMSLVSYADPLTEVQYVAISSASGSSLTSLPSYFMGMPWGS
mmetsp:Transcript_78219/g.219294  ORF Transcript_78219/g.219294 Transcript_78219/m.219294 type:complete len:203 (-) Transcript_78219:295-903(-)